MSEGEREHKQRAADGSTGGAGRLAISSTGGAEGEGADDELRELEQLIGRLERAAEQLRSGDLSTDAAATLVEECAVLANRAGAELERLSRADRGSAAADRPAPAPGQDSLL
ncbi:MAG TPA: hypothetical protein VMS02_01720 [Solirubrobacteraceae bacterium]|nr:hypothetical protein [Solirubrobacteraceae bacterium]